MITVHIRKQGGAAIITIPSNILKMLNIHIGSELELEITKKGFIARPTNHSGRKRYTLAELLHGVKQDKMKVLNKKTRWAREGKPVGRESA
ncbi:MAG TPA: AbrB/MazE/SpoVT family DNA-binding domain-containing protein [Gammaproteobacteria bacterium]|nr:AbrB/MazE/SpoVT family DNA-binding domain-containing protein [Gammaproteobacteria bacterium]